jgi:hypothetical protein
MDGVHADEIGLPSDVEDDDVVLIKPSDVIGVLADEIGLPSDVEDDVAEIGASCRCHCNLRCHMKFSPAVIHEHRALMKSRTEEEKSQILLERIRAS